MRSAGDLEPWYAEHSMATVRGLPLDLAARLDPTHDALPEAAKLRHAAVVAILMPDVDDARVVLIERSGTLRAHAGQLAFPGGKPEVEDADLVATALREAEEEVGLPRTDAVVLGRLGAVPTPTGFLIVPYVAWAPDGWRPVATSPEVHAIITPRVRELADPAIHRITGRGVWEGFHYEMHEFAIHTPPLWGATARMVWDFLERVKDE